MPTFAELFGAPVPLIQAPMAGSQASALAIAVANAGAVGSLPCALLGPEAIDAELGAIRAGTRGPVNVNFFCHQPPDPDPEREARWRAALAPYYRELGLDPALAPSGPARVPFGPEAAALLEKHRPAVVSFHFGLPADELLGRVRAIGARIICSATTVAEARALEAKAVDAIVAQGLEAGGHRGHFLAPDLRDQLPTVELVRAVTAAVRTPVIAAGGIGDRAGVAAALRAGAIGVQVGTAFLLCPEATTAPLHRAALAGDRVAATALTNLMTGRPARGIVNRLMRELGPMSTLPPTFPVAADLVAPLRSRAEAAGRDDFSSLWAGQGTAPLRAVPAAEVVRELM